MENQIQVIDASAIGQTVQELPEVTKWIQGVHDRGIQMGKSLLDKVESDGMNYVLYDEIREYIERARKSKSKMMERRSPITKLMDQYRAVFTAMEADFDVKKADSIAGKLQAYMNEYAAELERKRKEDERLRQQEAMIGQLVLKYKSDIKDEFWARVKFIESKADCKLKMLYDSINLQNYEEVKYNIQNVAEVVSNEAIIGKLTMESQVVLPVGIPDDFRSLNCRMEIYNAEVAKASSEITEYVRARKQYYIDILPSKKEALELEVFDEEAAKKKAEELKQYELAEAERLKMENVIAEAKKKAEEAMNMQQAQATMLFNAVVPQVPENAPKIKAKYSVEILNSSGFAAVFNFWWVNEGAKMGVDDLLKATAKKMITYAEKMANAKDPEFIDCQDLKYNEVITAK